VAKLRFDSVSYIYPGASRPAISEISCAIETGEIIAVLGANGSGKSTLGKIAAGLLTPTSGEITVSGIKNHPDWSGVGLLLQNPDEQLLTHSVESELAWGLENLALPRDEMRRRVNEMLETFELTALRSTPPETLSDGWKQVLALASLVAMRPAFLVLDEVTAFLDPYWRVRIRELCRQFLPSTGIIWISTETRNGLAADRVIVLEAGKLVKSGHPDSVLHDVDLEKCGLEPLACHPRAEVCSAMQDQPLSPLRR
jgi:energy-coupling factor transporter ATP-binding protein EcfA2